MRTHSRGLKADVLSIEDLTQRFLFDDDEEAGEEAIDYLDSLIDRANKLRHKIHQRLRSEDDDLPDRESIAKTAGLKDT